MSSMILIRYQHVTDRLTDDLVGKPMTIALGISADARKMLMA